MFDCSKIVIDRKSPEPLHIQLVRVLRRLIRELNPEEYAPLPSERFLCASLELHRKTVHLAYEELLNAGILRKMPNRSLVVNISARKRLEGAMPAIGIVIPQRFSQYISSNAHALRILSGIFDRAAERGYAVFLQELPGPDTPEKERKQFIETHFAKLSGILLLGDRGLDNDQMLSDLFQYSAIPQVAISGEVHQDHIGAVLCCFDKAADDMMDYFRKKDVHSVGIVDHVQHHILNSEFDYYASHRVATMKEKLLRGGFIVPQIWQIKDDSEGIDLSRNFPDAFWCVNDRCAIRLLEWNITGFLPIIGYDGVLTAPGLGTIRQPYREIGELAVELLLEQYQHGITRQNRIRYIEAEFISPV